MMHMHRSPDTFRWIAMLLLSVLSWQMVGCAGPARDDGGDAPRATVAKVAAGDPQRPLLEPGAVPQPVAEGFRFTEGPTLAPDGRIYFTDGNPNHAIHIHDPATRKTTLFRDKTTSGGANGMMFDRHGRLVVCEDRIQRRVTRTEDDRIIVLTDRYENQRYNGPNDLVTDQHDGIYFTDPVYDHRDDLDMDDEAVYYIDSQGRVTRIIDTMTKPNGIILSPDERTLYVADNREGTIMAFEVVRPGQVRGGRVFATLRAQGDDHVERPDGMTVDPRGRLYIAGTAHLWIYSAHGQLLHKVPTGPQTTNVCFGADGQTLYITMRRGLYTLKVNPAAQE